MNQMLRTTTSFLAVHLATILFLGITGYAQTTEMASKPKTSVDGAAVLQPVLVEYKAVKIGMTADEVLERLGEAEIADKDGFYYRFSDDEFVQIRLDGDKKVRLLSTTYSGGNAPKFVDVFGPEMKEDANPDGSVYKLVRYPDTGYWVAYSRTAGGKPSVTVTMQKMRKVK